MHFNNVCDTETIEICSIDPEGSLAWSPNARSDVSLIHACSKFCKKLRSSQRLAPNQVTLWQEGGSRAYQVCNGDVLVGLAFCTDDIQDASAHLQVLHCL